MNKIKCLINFFFLAILYLRGFPGEVNHREIYWHSMKIINRKIIIIIKNKLILLDLLCFLLKAIMIYRVSLNCFPVNLRPGNFYRICNSNKILVKMLVLIIIR